MTFGNDNLPKENKDHQLVRMSDMEFKPFSLLNLINGMDSYLNQFFKHINTQLTSNPHWINTYETDSEVIIEANLPGCTKNQIQLEIIGNQLRIGVENSILEEVNYETHTGRKQFYQRREHVIPLPYSISEKETKTSFHNETLKITFPKKDIKRRYLTIDDNS
ncbi:Hsp20/alpha crystallin family protein [Psychrobacillus sp. L4]|uniref:Hsp20/alpha crystallin family protein n=1 Tax=Psychrobacillus sp. L4 TaxID=3236892 RepID=UPI0036F26F59